MGAVSRAAIVAAGSTVLVFFGGASVWSAASGGPPSGDGEPQACHTELDRAGRAALDATGGVRVAEAGPGDEGVCYEVEVVLDDGSRVDVRLDESLTVVSTSISGQLFGG